MSYLHSSFSVYLRCAAIYHFLLTGMEQTQLIESVFTVIGLECGCLILKRISDTIFKKKKTDETLIDDIEEDFPDMYDGDDIAG